MSSCNDPKASTDHQQDPGIKLEGSATSTTASASETPAKKQPSTGTTSIELTPELRERIRKNRERALRIQAERKRKKEEEEKNKQRDELSRTDLDVNDLNKKPKTMSTNSTADASTAKASVVDCEDWERGLPEWITKKEAVSKYCLPEGTLAVCEVKTKDNPHRKGWAPMKLFRRSEIRERAYKRFNGKEGLIAERSKREHKRFEKDMAIADKIFQSSS